MPTQLHQILALEKTAKAATEGEVTAAYKDIQKPVLFQGLTRVYKPLDDADTEYLPPERKMVQMGVDDVIGRAVQAWSRQADLVATKDATNQLARADVLIDGAVLLRQVPVTTLLYLEKKLTDVSTLLRKAPVLDPETKWEPDPTTGQWRSEPEKTIRSKKVPKAFVRAQATDKHPAQVDMFTEDVPVGMWTKTLHSGAMAATRKAELLNRVETLAAAVKVAREYANRADVVDARIGDLVFGYLMAD